MKNLLFCLLLAFYFSGCMKPEPPSLFVDGVSKPVISLNGDWEVNLHPAGEFWFEDKPGSEWRSIRVPGECMMQGYAIRHDEPFVYRKTVMIPADFAEKKVRFRFDGVYNYARVWVNGQFVREHYGGFTRWECDITPYITPGQEATLHIEVTDRADDIAYGSGYAKHPIGGILREVTLMALPEIYPGQVTVITDLDGNYKNAELLISAKLSDMPKKGRLEISITDPKNNIIPLQNRTLNVSDTSTFIVRNIMRSPRLWDAEHPNLYKLTLSYYEDDRLVYQNNMMTGFREVKVEGNRLLVNGREIKLRGACRHDVHPLLGRVSTPDYELRDVRLAKEANMNFIRTSHYPPTANFLKLCDEYGIYVEDESGVCFVGSHRTEEYYPGASESDTAFTSRYQSQLEELVASHRNHPSVILWSIGNENSYGTNFQKSYDWVKATDTTRPVIFSYPGFVPDSLKAYDILSMHYPGITGDMEQLGKVTRAFGYDEMPVIFDEWAHVACYNNFTIKEDPNIRDFWGRSLDSMWTRVFEADGGLGGAIWGMIDETFMLPDTLPGYTEWWGKIDPNVIPAEYSGHTIGYGEWGIVDTWRRKKPEFWNTKKAYSPFKVLQTRFPNHTGSVIEVPVYNRFDHTDFNELRILYIYKGHHAMLKNIKLRPHTRGTLSIPLEQWDPSEPVVLEVRYASGKLIDRYKLRQEYRAPSSEKKEVTGEVTCTEKNGMLEVRCEDKLVILFDPSTGRMHSIIKDADTFAVSGPVLNLRTKGKGLIYSYHAITDYTGWKLLAFSHESAGGMATIRASGMLSDSLPVAYALEIQSDGSMRISYTVQHLPQEYIRELGLNFIMANTIDSIAWKRDGYWSDYPEDHLGVPEGATALYPELIKSYRKPPGKEWIFDTKSFYYEGTENEKATGELTHMAKSTRENIWEYNLIRDGSTMLSAIGQGDIHCRLSKSGDSLQLHINNEMDYVDLSWGNYQKNILAGTEYSNRIAIDLYPGE